MLVMPNIGDFIATAFGLALLLVGILLIVIVIVKKDWRDSDFLMKNFGYNPKDYD